MRRTALFILGTLISTTFVVPVISTENQVLEDVMKLHRKAIVFDAHCDTAMRLIGKRAIDLGIG